MLLRWAAGRRDERQRIDASAAESDTPVQMRTGHAASRAHETDHRLGPDGIALSYHDFGQVSEERVETSAVIDNHSVAGEVERLGEDDDPVVGCANWRAW